MASASLQSIKSRMKSVNSTMQITKAMELVASSKLRRAKEAALSSREFNDTLCSVMEILRSSAELDETVWRKSDPTKPKLIIVVAGDRGLAGGYNNNVLKLATSLAEKNDVFLPIGKRAIELVQRRGYTVFNSLPLVSESDVGDLVRLGNSVAEAYYEGNFSEVILVYTKFLSMLSCAPKYEQILPIKLSESKESFDPIYEGDALEMMNKIVPSFVGGMLNTAVLESSASEQSSRRNAMNSANKNAKEIIENLSISYNRARQGAITQELTEIISGSESL